MNNKEAELVLQMTQDLTFGSPSKETIRRLSPIIPNLIRAGLGIGFVPAITWGTAMESFLTLLRLTDTKLERTLRLS